jgi:hypothetical protein
MLVIVLASGSKGHLIHRAPTVAQSTILSAFNGLSFDQLDFGSFLAARHVKNTSW